MSSFYDKLEIGARGIEAMREALEREFNGRAMTVKFDGYDGFAVNGGDVVVAGRDGRAIRIEGKTEERYTGNLYIEEWSDYPNRVGWLSTLKADILAYLFLDCSELYLMDWPKLRTYVRETAHRWKRKVPSVTQPNQTLGALVPVSLVQFSVGFTRIDLRNGQRLMSESKRGQTSISV